MESILRAVFFDAGGTILHVRSSVGEIYAAAAARRGYPFDAGEVNRAFRRAWKRSLRRRQEVQYEASDEVLREEWRKVVHESFDGRIPPEIVGETFEELYDHFSGPEPWTVAQGARETFAALKEEGLALGILSNWDSRLPRCLEELGILEFFDHLVISYKVGVEKPHPRIFEEASLIAQAPPGSLLMVGDSLEQDILPAIDLGWQALWLSTEKSHGNRQVPRVAGFDQILPHIRAAK